METRSIDNIKKLMIESKERIMEIWRDLQNSVLSDPTLAALNSTSQTAIWRLWAFILSVNIWVHEKLWEYFKTEIEALAAKSISGTPAWYAAMALNFQYGYPLLYENFSPTYSTDDPASRIITQAAVVEGNFGLVIIKVAKGETGALTPLTALELSAFESYINQIKFAGTLTEVISLPADLLSLNIVVHFNAIYNLLELQQNVETAITNYLQNLPFNGLFYTNGLIDALQAIAGVVDVDINSLSAVQGTGTPVSIDRIYQTVAGYMDINPTSPLSTNITYNPMP